MQVICQVWIRYMEFWLKLSELDRAREVLKEKQKKKKWKKKERKKSNFVKFEKRRLRGRKPIFGISFLPCYVEKRRLRSVQ